MSSLPAPPGRVYHIELSDLWADTFTSEKPGRHTHQNSSSVNPGPPADVSSHSGAQGRTSWYRRLKGFTQRPAAPVSPERTICPEASAGWFGKLTFSWINPLLYAGRHRPLGINDIWLVDPERRVHALSTKFGEAFRRRKRHEKHALALAIFDTFSHEFWMGGIWQLAASICQAGIPLTLRFLLSFITDSYEAANARSQGVLLEGPPLWNGLGWVVGLLLLQIIQGIGINQSSYKGFMLGAQARGVLMAAMFEKSTKLLGQPCKTQGSDQPTGGDPATSRQLSKNIKSKGSEKVNQEIEDVKTAINLMSSDVGQVNQAAKAFHLVWTAPITIVLASVIVLYNLTYSAIPGICLLLLGILGLRLAVKSIGKRQPMLRRSTNARVSLTQEVLRHVGFVKYNAWDPHFLRELKRRREKELQVVIRLLTTRDVMHTVSTCLPVFAAVLSLAIYSATGHQLTVSTVFSSVVIFNTLRVPFASLSVSVRQVADGWAALKRLQEFLLAREPSDETIWDRNSESAVSVKQGHFTWEACSNIQDINQSGKVQFSLANINLSIRRGELVAVVGASGSGKTSLLRALEGQMPKIEGEVSIGVASRAVCPQNAWIQSASLKDNILFGKAMVRSIYDQVIESCALAADIKSLPAGDDTEIGEHGITLSGGQRQRVSLARAMYAGSDLILLDDPLSAVDAHVGRHLFRQAICEVLKEKTRILVTHQHGVLRWCDRILWMENGHIRALDTYLNLIAAEPDFRAMVVSSRQNGKGETQKNEQTSGTVSSTGHEGNEKQKQKNNDNRVLAGEESGATKESLDIFKAYVRSSGCLLNGAIPVAFLILAQSASTLTNLWLSYWTSNKFDWLSNGQYVAMYVTLAAMQAALTLCFAMSLSILGTRATRKILDQAIAKVIGAPMSFHDLQPLGRIVNLFTQDSEVVDQQLPDSLCKMLFSIAMVASICILIVGCFPWFAVALGPLTVVLLYVTAYYKSTEKQLKRHEALLRAVMFSQFSESVSGMQTIKAYNMQSRFAQRVRDAIDNMNATTFLTIGAQRWLAVWLDLIAISTVLTTGLLVIFGGGQTNPSLTGVVLASVLALRIQIQLIVQQLGEFEDSMNSVERLHHYSHQLPEEPSHPTSVLASEVPGTWPARGDIRMTNASLSYRPELPMVLKDLSIDIQDGEKIGIVGRTGAGKSSLTAALFRLVELSRGKIIINGLDISKVPLPTLRSRISIIPQDPTLFQGTVRSNLDPFSQCSDMELWEALHQVEMNRSRSSTTATQPRLQLDAEVEEGGANYSQGQRQLLSIARAILTRTRIVVCDEATSSLDPETDAKIQQAMMRAFSGKTVLTIAHRLQTVVRYDRICVLEKGHIAELDTPTRLWEQEGIFRGMCDQMDIERRDFEFAP
ncbi:P-loop containing nucleoside triphosphate hydrolase protein [Hypoxylon sp. NC1633]|nr:P-loop containing nucleoside triphosphate hydrolase protein [Hypoxylon sp. NC1633]